MIIYKDEDLREDHQKNIQHSFIHYWHFKHEKVREIPKVDVCGLLAIEEKIIFLSSLKLTLGNFPLTW